MQGADASIREVKPGSVPALAPDEGLLVISVDTTNPFSMLKIRRDVKLLGGDRRSGLSTPGRTNANACSSRRQATTAGTSINYYAARLGLGWHEPPRYDDREFHFHVKPAVINYPGELVNRPYEEYHSLIHVANRGLRAIDWLRAIHPVVYAQYPFEYGGHYVDPFPEFYRVRA